ncbi:MAG: septum formation initiator family protein [Cellulomonadaceae bacterium]|nr:septum formation initiator family protein [Cellulomonadaceae bacterium]
MRPQSGRNETAKPRRTQAPPANAAAAKQETVTWRLLLLALVGLLTIGLLAPTLRGAIDQYQQYYALEQEYRDALAESARLDAELARWDDPAFVASQARTRLNFVSRGDKVWRPIGAEILAEDIDPATGLRVKQGIVGARENQPWYSALLESVKVADGPVEATPEPENLTAILGVDD